MDGWPEPDVVEADPARDAIAGSEDWASTLAARFLATRDGQPWATLRPTWEEPTGEYGAVTVLPRTPAQYMRSVAADQLGQGARAHDTWRWT